MAKSPFLKQNENACVKASIHLLGRLSVRRVRQKTHSFNFRKVRMIARSSILLPQ
jgi:hypothetical protein